MKALIFTILFFQEPSPAVQQQLAADQATVKTVHIGITRFVQADFIRVKDSKRQNLLVADFTFFRKHFRYAGEYSGHLIKGN
jgi:hypothetical protein